VQLERRSGGPARTIAARIVPLDGNTDAGELQLLQGDRVRWGDGESGVRRLVIEARSDADGEAPERYAVQLETVEGAALLAAAAFVVTIAPHPGLSPVEWASGPDQVGARAASGAATGSRRSP
jgi:hypothetical protein